jgi:hypothetical protein
MTATHLFVAPGDAAFGEALLGLRLAHALHARGDRVLFLAPRALAVLLGATPFAHGHADPIVQVLDRALPDIIRDRRADTVTLLDLAVTLVVCHAYGLDPAFLGRLPVPVFALDIFDVGVAGGRRYDMGEAGIELAAIPGAPIERMVPVPFARPTTSGAYRVVGEPALRDAAAVARTRAGLGLGADEPVVALVTAKFQARGLSPFQIRLVDALPGLLRAQLAALGPVRVLHLGPQPLPDLGPCYRHVGQVAHDEFRRIVAAADVLYTLNLSATSAITALEVGTPVVAAVSGQRGSADEVIARLAAPSPAVRAALAQIGAVFPFRVFPLGLHDFMAPLVVDNPYVDALAIVELFDEAGTIATLRGLLFDPDLRAAAQARARAYGAAIAALPGPPIDRYPTYSAQ